MGKKCTQCGSSGPFHKDKRTSDGLHSWCKKCMNEKNRENYYKNKERYTEKVSEWQRNNPGKVKKYKQKWKDENPDARRKHGRDKYWRDPEKAREQTTKWKKENKEKHAFYQRNREYKKRGAGGSHSQEEWVRLCEKYNNRCLACGKHDSNLTRDHVIPISKGGSNDISNIQPLCVSCNSSKQDKCTDYRKRGGIKRWMQEKLF